MSMGQVSILVDEAEVVELAGNPVALMKVLSRCSDSCYREDKKYLDRTRRRKPGSPCVYFDNGDGWDGLAFVLLPQRRTQGFGFWDTRQRARLAQALSGQTWLDGTDMGSGPARLVTRPLCQFALKKLEAIEQAAITGAVDLAAMRRAGVYAAESFAEDGLEATRRLMIEIHAELVRFLRTAVERDKAVVTFLA